MGVEIVPTVVPRSFEDILNAERRYGAFADSLHIDVADGAFAPHATWTPADGERLPEAGSFSYEVHLMAEEPRMLGLAFLRAGARSLIGHTEAFADTTEAHGCLDAWRFEGAARVGLALLYHTPFEVVEPLVPVCDFVHLMTIERVGEQGIPFAPDALTRVAAFRERFPEVRIAVDGGVSEKNISELSRAGAQRFLVGSALAGAENPTAVYKALKERAEGAVQ